MAPILASPGKREEADSNVPDVLHIATLSGVLACLMRHFRASLASLPLLQQPLASMPIGSWSPDSPIGQQGQLHSSDVRHSSAFHMQSCLCRLLLVCPCFMSKPSKHTLKHANPCRSVQSPCLRPSCHICCCCLFTPLGVQQKGLHNTHVALLSAKSASGVPMRMPFMAWMVHCDPI
jgi:hypothetical protein